MSNALYLQRNFTCYAGRNRVRAFKKLRDIRNYHSPTRLMRVKSVQALFASGNQTLIRETIARESGRDIIGLVPLVVSFNGNIHTL